MTLSLRSANSHIRFGTVFAHLEASVGLLVPIGLYCIIGPRAKVRATRRG
jgi:hypothetical protein